MLYALLMALAQPPIQMPPAIARAEKRMDYAELLRRVKGGESFTVASGVRAMAGQVACKIPGEPNGVYECFPVYKQECNGGVCRIVVTATMRPFKAPQVMP